ncbi:MAG: hypothetical protein JJE51_07000 [Thermoanaerobaculia bacterium]|nr:hypothetical protein [Thermoanaerobaculia bacterium]
MRIVALLPLLLAFSLFGDEIVVAPSCNSLTPPQRAWAEAFVRGETREALAGSASTAGLNTVAAYIASNDAKEAERLWIAAADEPLVVVARPDKTDRIIGVALPDQNRWLSYLATNFEAFEKTLPGYQHSWRAFSTPVGRFVVADLLWNSSGSFPRGTYPPFDPSLRSELGRSFVYWRNAIEQGWFEREILPAVTVALTPESLRQLKPEALTGWYAARFTTYRAGKEFPIHGWERYDSVNIAKADVLAVLATDWLAKQKMRSKDDARDQAAMAVAMALYAAADVKRGNAPPPHGPASRVVLEYLRRNGAIQFDRETKKWSIVTRRLQPALYALAAEILSAESQGDRAVIEGFLKRYETVPQEMEDAIAAIAAVVPAGMPNAMTVKYAGCAQPSS